MTMDQPGSPDACRIDVNGKCFLTWLEARARGRTAVAISVTTIQDLTRTTTDIIDYVATDQNDLTSTSTRTVIIEAAALQQI